MEDAKAFLRTLHENNETYHPEDDAHYVCWETCETTEAERDQLNKLRDDMYALPEVPDTFDPCGYLLDLCGHVIE